MEEAKVQKIFTQLLGAVAYVHGKSCVHRDLKLENILLDKNGNVKLCDFGFTREYQGNSSYLQTWCGTVCYSAPEMLKGEKYGGEKVDVWSLGIILYALLTGELPFDEDDETATKTRILKEDPTYPDYLPEGAKDLICKLLSKRPLIRPSLADILRHPWLAEHAPQQQEILKIQQPAPFSTDLEKTTLQRMKSAGVDIDMVIENVLAQRCDTLAGWWALLVEKEERKDRRRQRKRRERDAEAKSIRRLSAASSRLLAATALRDINEEHPVVLVGDPPRTRGRNASRSSAVQPDLPRVTEGSSPTPDDGRPPPVEKDYVRNVRSASSSRQRPMVPPKEFARRPRAASRSNSGSLQLTHTNNGLLAPPPFHQKRKRPFKDQIAHIKHWFKESTKRTSKSPSSSNKSTSTASLRYPPGSADGRPSPSRDQVSRGSTTEVYEARKVSSSWQGRPDLQLRTTTYPTRPRVSTTSSYGSTGSRSHGKRPSLSPAPLTPRSSVYRRSSAGLKGRKSTSSSVSSFRSIHTHHHTHSKASSTSSASPSILSTTSRTQKSPHSSIKVIHPGTPTSAGNFPPGIRVARRAPPGSLGPLPAPPFEERATGIAPPTSAYSPFGPASPGLHPIFAKKKRSIFKGPATGTNTGARSGRGTLGGSEGGSRATSVQGRPSNDVAIVGEDEEEELDQRPMTLDDERENLFHVDEDEEEEGYIEEVEAFGPIAANEKAFVIEGGEEEEDDDDEAQTLKGGVGRLGGAAKMES